MGAMLPILNECLIWLLFTVDVNKYSNGTQVIDRSMIGESFEYRWSSSNLTNKLSSLISATKSMKNYIYLLRWNYDWDRSSLNQWVTRQLSHTCAVTFLYFDNRHANGSLNPWVYRSMSAGITKYVNVINIRNCEYFALGIHDRARARLRKQRRAKKIHASFQLWNVSVCVCVCCSCDVRRRDQYTYIYIL